MKLQWFVLAERNPDREPVWSGGRPASSAGAQWGAPVLLKNGQWGEEQEMEDGSRVSR